MITQKYKDAQTVKNAQLRGLLDRLPIVDHADRRKKLRPHDDGRECIVELMKGAAVVLVAMLVLANFI
jgi:hypothetical protein